ncbi:MAG TPA: M14 family metallopeptidase [Gemmatimonadaceae bacterium]|nr:M14 family metallopeptidase [Gemmatimonadaceae bacterium]
MTAHARHARPVALLLAAALSACATTRPATPGQPGRAAEAASTLPRTRAERTGYLETSHYADVVAFLDSLKALRAPLAFGSIGRTVEGRDIPYVVASRPLVHTPAEAKATGKPIVYVQGNIHAGEVEGKEALLALLRDLTFAPGPDALDSIVLVAVPIYNADGNEKFGPQERQRTEQNGPDLVGTRANAQGLDLNRDYVKAEAPETRASLAMFDAWDPDVFVDLHTTDGSFHGYALTYSPSLSPAAPLGEYTRSLLAELRKRVRERDGYETFDYGNFNDGNGREVSTDTVHGGWYTYDHRPRYGTNYYGLRNRVAVLSEAFSHDPFERRVKSTYAFTHELLSLVAEHAAELKERTASTPSWTVHRGLVATGVPIRAAFPDSAPSQPVRYEILERTGDSSRTQPGVPRGIRRTGRFVTREMPVFDRFVSTLDRPVVGQYVISGRDTATLRRLAEHGVEAHRITELPRSLDEFVIDSVVRATRPFQGHRETRVFGQWRRATTSIADPYSVDAVAKASLVMYLLDPESDDSFGTWDLYASPLAPGLHPVRRVMLRTLR